MTRNGIGRFESVAPHVQSFDRLCRLYFWLRWLWYPWIFLPMNIEWRIIENRDIQVNASLSPPPVWKMDLYLFKHDENLLYTCDRYSLIWFTHKYCNCPSHGHESCPMPQHTPFPSIWNARHAWTLNLTLHIIMITHYSAIAPITSAHCICYHDPDCALTLSKTWIFVHIL